VPFDPEKPMSAFLCCDDHFDAPVPYPAGTVACSTPWVDWLTKRRVFGTAPVLPSLAEALDYIEQLEEDLLNDSDNVRCSGCGQVMNKDIMDDGPEDDDGCPTWYCESCQD
jgi:hypothetical protein